MILSNLLLLIYLFCSTLLYSNNKHPIILLHGFLGWGRHEMSEYYYWGGEFDLETQLKNAGYDVYTVSVGPISSNWDRAIETFYQIKGGQVDYGFEKASKYNIIQQPPSKNYKGLYTQWNAKNPIHIIAHSQGGQTATMLEEILKKSYKNNNSPLLSNSLNGWIKSITTISTPHNGATLVPIMLETFPFIQSLAPWFGSIENSTINKLYNFDLEHWKLNKKPEESINEYFKRLSSSPITMSKNLCSWDLSPKGASEFNKIYAPDKDVYYFSFSTYASKKMNQSFKHKPDSKMSLHLWATSILIGQSNKFNNLWYENDGVVNTISMHHPEGSKNMEFDGVPKQGIWQHIKKLHMDHQAIIGHNVPKTFYSELFALYNNHCKLLYRLK